VKRKTEKGIRHVPFLILLLAGLTLFGGEVSAADVVVSGDIWPMWPEPDVRIKDLDVLEPATFLSIGRDVVAWPFFGSTTVSGGYLNFVDSGLYFTIKKEDGSFVTVQPIKSSIDDLFIVTGNTSIKDPSDGETTSGFRSAAVFPEYSSSWLNGIPNEDIGSADITKWKSFLMGNFADSGHAPPMVVWPEDPWLKAYRIGGYEVPAKWKDRVVCLWPTNQGLLHGFEVYPKDVSPYVNRKWGVVPNPAFRQTLYHELRNIYRNSGYYRITLLDGPVTVRDVEIDGEWRRIAVGTTGMGTKQVLKPQDAWLKLGQNTVDTPIPSPSVSDKGRAFGVYAFDITDLQASATPTTLDPLWSVSNVFFETSANDFADYFPEKKTAAAKSDYAEYAGLKFSASKPLIGYTKDESGNRIWHVIILGVEKGTNKYKWLDVDPSDGSVLRSGYFRNLSTNQDEVLPEILEKKNGPVLYTQEQAESLFPSRILAAFPPPDSSYNEPLMSDVYVYLSNGGIYRWDLNEESHAPSWIITLVNNDGQATSPLTDFDISYLDGSTFMAANVVLTFQGGSDHETEGLVVLNLSEIEKQTISDRGSGIKVPPGQDGDVVDSSNDYLLVLQLQLEKGAYTPESKTVLASPVFILERLYLAFYELNTKGKGSEVSRLYTLLFGGMMGQGKNQKLEEGTLENLKDLINLDDVEAAMMMIDSSGQLVLLDTSGNVLATLDTGLDPGSGGEGEGSEITGSGVSTVYWKIVN